MSSARILRDYSTLHVDLVEARRYIFGKAVVHGVHAVLAALNEDLENFDSKKNDFYIIGWFLLFACYSARGYNSKGRNGKIVNWRHQCV